MGKEDVLDRCAPGMGTFAGKSNVFKLVVKLFMKGAVFML